MHIPYGCVVVSEFTMQDFTFLLGIENLLIEMMQDISLQNKSHHVEAACFSLLAGSYVRIHIQSSKATLSSCTLE